MTELATGSLLACFPCRFADVRSQLRKDLGYTEEDGFGTLTFLEPSKTEKSGHSPSMCSLSSGGQISTQPVSPSAHRSVSKSPDCLSSRTRLLYSLISVCRCCFCCITGGSCHKYDFCHDKSFVATNTFAMTKTCLLRQNRSFVVTNVILLS